MMVAMDDDPYATAGAVKDGSVTVTLGGMDDFVDPADTPRDEAAPSQCHARADTDSHSARR